MTREQRDAAKQRVVALSSRLNAIETLTENMSDKGGIEIANIINETKAEIDALAKRIATRIEFLFNFIGGGWNSEWAFTPEEAIAQAITRFGDPRLESTTCRVDIASFRKSTAADKDNLLSSFY
jgi:hypothetical protein